MRGKPPELPAELRAALSPREFRCVLALVAGATWQEALTASGIPPRAKLRDRAPPRHVVEASEYLIAEIAHSAAISRKWILTNLVALYQRAVAAEPVLDRSGRPTGEYRFDGATARGSLELLGKELGMFGHRVVHDIPNDVRALLAEVGRRGKPALEQHPGRTIQHEPAASAAESTA